jgi:hypothetical protein
MFELPPTDIGPGRHNLPWLANTANQMILVYLCDEAVKNDIATLELRG